MRRCMVEDRQIILTAERREKLIETNQNFTWQFNNQHYCKCHCIENAGKKFPCYQ